MRNVIKITNFKFSEQQNFLSKTYIFSWDKINLEPNTNNASNNDFRITYTRIQNPDNSYSYNYEFNGSYASIELVKGNTYRFFLDIQDYDGEVNNGLKIVKTNDPENLDWSTTPSNKSKFLVTEGLSHSDGTIGEEANSGKNYGILTYTVPLNLDATEHFTMGPWRNDNIVANNVLTNRISYTEPSDISVFYNIYFNDKLIRTTQNNFFKVESGVGCERKCFKVKAVFKNNKTQIKSYSDFSEELCFTSPVDRYCNLPINLWQNQKISDEEKKRYQQKLENLKVKKTSSKIRYAKAIKNKTIASSFVPSGRLRAFYFKECE